MKTLGLIGLVLVAGCQPSPLSTVQQLPKSSPPPLYTAPQPDRIVPVSQPVPIQPPTQVQPPPPLAAPPLEAPKNYIIHERTTIVMEEMPQQEMAPQGIPLTSGGPTLPSGGPNQPVPPLTGPTVQEGMPSGPLPTGPLPPGPLQPTSNQYSMWRQQMETTVLVGPPGSPSR